MFKKKIKCVGCGKKIDKKFDFCPYCGYSIRGQKRREKDFDEQLNNLTKQLSQDFGMPIVNSFPFKAFVKRMSKNIEKQFREMDQEMNRGTNREIKRTDEKKLDEKTKSKPMVKDGQKIGDIKEIRFPGGRGFSVKIEMGGMPRKVYPPTIFDNSKENRKKLEKVKEPAIKSMSEAKAKKYAKLPKSEPETKVRRFTDRVVYEVALPSVKNIKDVIINKLQNSIEIKAFAKDKAYFKLLPVSLPIKRYKLENETLVLELVP